MDTSLSMALEPLAKGSLRSLRNVQGQGIAVFTGCLWITQDGDRRDIIVGAGDSWRFDRDGVVVIEALADTRLLRLDPIAPSPLVQRPSAEALHRQARRLRAIAIGNLVLRLVGLLRRPWARA